MLADPALTIIMVSYNTAELTLAAIRTCLETTRETLFRLVVLDNASPDGSADAIAAAFPPGDYPQLELIRSEDNLGFARANNVVAAQAETEYLLLLNPDTECHDIGGIGAVDALMRFARETPEAGIWGGRTVFPDESLNPGSCWMRITPWSLLCWASGLTAAAPASEIFNPEALGGWPRDSVRHVDIVGGCFFLIRRDLWTRLGGFELKYFMYGEEADLCLRATREAGARPVITPNAQIMHVFGAASQRTDKRIAVMKARSTLIRDHWPAWQIPLGCATMWLGAGLRRFASRSDLHRTVWVERRDWLAGYRSD